MEVEKVIADGSMMRLAVTSVVMDMSKSGEGQKMFQAVIAKMEGRLVGEELLREVVRRFKAKEKSGG